MKQPIPLTPAKVRVLVRCPLHYHFLQQSPTSGPDPVDKAVRAAIRQLHAAGGPARLSLGDCLKHLSDQPAARSMVERYYHRLEQGWPGMIAGNEIMQLRISIGQVSLALEATIDRLDKTGDGGILAILFRTEEDGPIPAATDLQRDHAITIYHALVAATYPLKRPVRIQEWWLQPDQQITIELGEDAYRRNLSDLREPVKALARSEVMARPGLHCETCTFKYRGCPVYAHEEASQDSDDDLVPSLQRGKISPRKWVFKI